MGKILKVKSKYATKVALFYLIFSVFWIVFSDILVAFVGKAVSDITLLQTVKGVTFVLVTAYLLYKLVQSYMAELKAEKDKLMGYFDFANMLVVSIDTHKNIVFINKKVTEALNTRVEECLGKKFIDFFHPIDYITDLNIVFEEIFSGKTKQTMSFETKVVSSEGSERIVYWQCSLLKGSNDAIDGAICYGEDVTARLTAEKLVTKFKYVIEQSPNSVVITDTNGSIEYVNKKFVELTGYSYDEVLGKNPRILKSGKTPTDVYTELWKKITSGETWVGEFCNRKKNGEFYWEYAKISPIKDPKTGQIINFLGIKEDITYQKKLEAELLHAQKMEAIGVFAGGVAHDFNNILTAIIGYGNVLLLKLNESDPLRFYVEQILFSSEKAANLTQKLLTFARKQPLSKKVVNLNDLVKSLTKMLDRIIGENIEIKTILSYERNLNIFADPNQIEQVLMNLASNAKDAMSSGGMFTIETSYFYMDNKFIEKNGFGTKGDYAVLKVSDTGTGIDEEVLQHIFDPFFSTKEVGKGTGLGLSIVYGIVKSHSGYITVDSEYGKGTTFSIYLPLTKKTIEASIYEVEEKHFKHGGETVLVAEDDKLVLNMIKDFFENYGYKVITASNGDEALSYFKEYNNDIAVSILDVVMPKKSGIEVYRQMKTLNPLAKVIIMSGYATELDKCKADLGKDTLVVQKPVSPKELVKMIRELLDK